ncbi:MAG: HzsA-related protein, partial [Limisphaerales bacterium]
MPNLLVNVLRVVVVGFAAVLAQGESAPSNLALQAAATAGSEHNAQYLARFAIDGKIPSAGSLDDLGRAWCVQGATHRAGADFTLTWTNAVTVSDLVYWARTAWFAEEGWKDYEVWLDQAGTPAARGQLAMGHGPQLIRLDPPATVRTLTLRFTSSHGGANPGAAEIQAFAERLPEQTFARFRALPPGRPEPFDDEIEESSELRAFVSAGRLGFDTLLLIRRRELNPSHVYTYHVEGFGAGGGLGLYQFATRHANPATTPEAANSRRPGTWKELVASPEGQILDCDLDYDGREILFSWRRTPRDGYQLFTVRTDGTGLRQLTDGPHHNYNACWLPDGGIAFLSTRTSRFAYCWISPVGVLHRMERDGSKVTPLSANIVNDFTPSVMHDGRILYSRWEYVDKPAIPIQSLWTIRPDGTGLAGYFGNRVLSPATFMEARTIPGRSEVLCVLTSHNGPCRGAIGLVDIQHGNNSPASLRNLTPEVDIGQTVRGDGNSIRGPYESPFPIDPEFFLVSKRGTVLLRSYEGARQARLVDPLDGLGFYSPQPLRTRARPPVLARQLDVVDTSSGGPPHRVETSGVAWATVVLQDVYRGLEPWVKRGEVKEICVVEEMRKAVRTDVNNRAFGFQFPVISCGATYAGKQVWGYAPVAEDGSASFPIPAGRPIYFLALDAEGRAVQRMRTFTHLMPGEVQGCIGCHEPRDQTVAAPLTRPRAPTPLRPPDWGEGIGFDYTAHVQPVLDAHCVRCHSGPTPPRKVDLCGDKTDFFNVSYEWLARGRQRSGEAEWDSPYVSWIPTYNGMEQNILEVTPKAWGSPRSPLADLLLAGHPDTNGVPRLEMEPREIRRLLTWMDLNVPYYGTSETAHPDRPGCRQFLPPDLDRTLADVASRRCAGCHEGGRIPRQFWTRITNPHLNDFLLAPLAKEAGGSGRCGAAVFTSANDPDYQAILRTFDPILAALRERPRMDMAGAIAADVDRNCLGQLD